MWELNPHEIVLETTALPIELMRRNEDRMLASVFSPLPLETYVGLIFILLITIYQFRVLSRKK